MVEQGAAPAGRRRTLLLHSGGPGNPFGRHYGRSARSFAGLDNLPKGSSGQSVTRPKGGGAKLSEPGLKPGNAGPGTEIAAMERREAPASFKRGCG